MGEAVRGAIDEALKVREEGQDQGQLPQEPPVVRVEVSDGDEQQRILINARSDDTGSSTTIDGATDILSATKDGIITGILPGFEGFPRRKPQDDTVRQTSTRPATVLRPDGTPVATVKFELEDAIVPTPSDIVENDIFDPAEYDFEEDGSLSAIPADTDDEGAPFDNRILGGRSSANIVQATVVEDLVSNDFRLRSVTSHDMTSKMGDKMSPRLHEISLLIALNHLHEIKRNLGLV